MKLKTSVNEVKRSLSELYLRIDNKTFQISNPRIEINIGKTINFKLASLVIIDAISY